MVSGVTFVAEENKRSFKGAEMKSLPWRDNALIEVLASALAEN